ncbi:prolyl endopeptidase [Acaryochloris marina MBIC10699]|nr:prolyl endopeptidase [Acaryochloris marina MBIC10699]
MILDPNLLSEDGTVALSGLALSDNAQYLAYGLSESGSDWQTWHIRDLSTGEDLSEQLQWIKFSGAAWTADHQGFFYGRYDEPDENNKLEGVNYYQKLFYHRLGTPQSADLLIYERPDQKEWGFQAVVSEDGDYLLIHVWLGTDARNLLFYKDLKSPESPVTELISIFEASYSFIGNQKSLFWVKTDLNAPRGRVIAIDLHHPDQEHWQTIISESADTLEGIGILNHQFVATYLKDARSQVKCFALDGQELGEVSLPGVGSVSGFYGKTTETKTFYSFTSFTTPTSIYRFDLESGESTLYWQPQVDFNPTEYETQQVFFTSKDGTQIPLFLSHKKGLIKDGKTPVYLYGYGGFNVFLTPSFSPVQLAWMEMGGIFALPTLRGGGEYGEEWHQAGMKHHKQTVFDDFIAAAEYLITAGYTCTDKLAIAGGSNGGLLVGACMTQRPDLFGAALPAVGVMDMLRFHQFTIGWAWCAEYGSSENAEDFPVLYAYSPLHNLQGDTSYPATLITTADHDDRVVPAHSFKFAAALQAAHSGMAPTLIRIETKAGHGAGKPTQKQIEEASDRLAFVKHVLA